MDQADKLLNPYNESKIMRCSDCPIICQYRKIQLAKDENATCLFPPRRLQAMDDGMPITLLDEVIIGAASQEVIEALMEQFRLEKNGEFGIKLLKCLIDLKKNYWPATQKNITANIKDFGEQLKLWKQAQIEVKKIKENKPLEIIEKEVEEEIAEVEKEEEEEIKMVYNSKRGAY